MLTIEIQRLLFLFVTVLGAATSTPLPANYTPYETNGTILGDFTDVKSFPPKVLLRFLAGCANVTIIDSDRCLVSTFAKLRVPFDLDDTFACDTCSNPPNITDSLIEASALEAQSECAAAGESASLLDMTTLSQQYMTIVASPCWGSLRQDDAYLFVESKWLRTCASANLPYPIPTEFINMFTIDSVQHRSTLTCMLDKFFDADPIVFGLPSAPMGSPESCLVPGYDNITSNCESIIGPKAYGRCSSRSGDNQVMSMAFTGNDEAIFVEEFCSILETLNTDVGRECMMDVCDFDPTPSPSRVPSSDPSSIPTTPSPAPFPVSSPSKTPSTKPSPAPVFTSLPTPSPGKVTPTSRPSPSGKTPSSAPSQLPSSEPTVLATKPSSVPFSTPTPKTPTPNSSPSKTPTSEQTAPSTTPTKPPSPASSPSKTPTTDLKSPSVKPSQAPFSAPSDKTQSPVEVESETPTSRLSPPSASPSAEASPNPSATAPSSQPSTSPTFSPSASQFPSTGAVQAYVGVEVLAMVTINVTLNDIPSDSQQSFVNVLESAVESIVDGLSTATIRIPFDLTRLRRLQSDDDFMDLEVTVAATRDCRQADCQAYGIRVADGIEGNIRTNIADGGLVKSIRALAAAKNVTILETADLYHVKFLNQTITAASVVSDNNDDATSSAPPQRIGLVSCAIAIISSSIMLVL